MAAKKKSSKKKAAKKKASPKPKKAAKKKVAKKVAKKATRAPKARAVKKVAKKKAAPKKKKAIRIAPKGPTIGLAPEGMPLTIEAVFEIAGNVTVKHFRGSTILGLRDIPMTGSVTFPNAKRFDGISITGVCAGPTKITTDRVTDPLSDEQHAREFEEGPISDSLSVR